MYLSQRKLSTIDNVVAIPNYNRRAYDGNTVGYSLTGIEHSIPILIVYQNKNDYSDVLVDIRFENVNTREQTMLTKEFLDKFLADTEYTKYIVEKDGRVFFSGNHYHIGVNTIIPGIRMAEATNASFFLDNNAYEVAIAIHHKKVTTLADARKVRELLNTVNAFKNDIPDNSYNNRFIANLESEIADCKGKIAYFDKLQNNCCEQMEEDKMILEQYGVNWKKFIEE